MPRVGLVTPNPGEPTLLSRSLRAIFCAQAQLFQDSDCSHRGSICPVRTERQTAIYKIAGRQFFQMGQVFGDYDLFTQQDFVDS